MLKRNNPRHRSDFFSGGERSNSSELTQVDRFLEAGRRQWRIVVILAILGFTIGAAYIELAVPQYTATINLLINSQSQKNKTDDEITASIADLTFDTSAIDSQVEVLKSEKVALSVISALQLTSDAEFLNTHGGVVGQILLALQSQWNNVSQWFSSAKAQRKDKFKLQREAVRIFEKNLDVRRVLKTYVIEVNYTSTNPEKAAAVANALGDAYLKDQFEARLDAARSAGQWMEGRIAQLKADSLASDAAAQKFKAENGIVTFDTDGKNPESRLESNEHMKQLDEQLVLASADTARAEARYNQITEMMKAGPTDATVTDSLGNPVITELRQKYLTAAKSEAELESKLGANHSSVVRLRGDMNEYRRQIFEELGRIAETYRSEGQVARAKEEALVSSMTAAYSQNAGTNQTMVTLRGLQRESEAYRTLYQAFLERYQETVHQGSFPAMEARVITAAIPPDTPSRPKRLLVLAGSLVLGGMLGGGVAAAREHRDRVFRTASQVREDLGIECLGMIDFVKTSAVKSPLQGGSPTPASQIAIKDPVQRYSIDHPLSNFSETLRSIKVAADMALVDRKVKTIGVISVLPDEGKSTVAKNFASLLAHSGAKTLLIDGDLGNPDLTRTIADHASFGLLEGIRGQRPLRDLLLLEPETGLAVLPAVVKKRVNHTSELLCSPGMRSLLNDAGEAFEYIVFDLPPLGPVVDTRAAHSLFDAFVCVIDWGHTARTVVQTMLCSEDAIYDKCLGAVLNKVEIDRISLYENIGSRDYYHSRYRKYYPSEEVVTS